MGIREYFLFQPDSGRKGRRLEGYQLWGRKYLELPAELGPGGGSEIVSELLGVSLRVEGELLRVRNQETGEDYVWHVNRQFRMKAAERQSRLDAEARQVAERQSRLDAEALRVAEQARKTAERRLAALEAQLRESVPEGKHDA